MKEGTDCNLKHRVEYLPYTLHGGIVHIPCNTDKVNGISEEYIKAFVSEKRSSKYIDIRHLPDDLSEDQLRCIIPGLKDRINQKSLHHRILQFLGKDDNYSLDFGAVIIFSTSYTVIIELTERLLFTYQHFKKCLDKCYQEYISSDLCLYSAIDDISPMEPILGRGSKEFYRNDCTADRDFTESISQLNNKIIDLVNKLKILGIEESFIRTLFKPEQKLSRLLITKDYRIFLPDYWNIEIKMEPLPKAVYLLFRKYDAGIVFKGLPFYHYDLYKIYSCETKSYT